MMNIMSILQEADGGGCCEPMVTMVESSGTNSAPPRSHASIHLSTTTTTTGRVQSQTLSLDDQQLDVNFKKQHSQSGGGQILSLCVSSRAAGRRINTPCRPGGLVLGSNFHENVFLVDWHTNRRGRERVNNRKKKAKKVPAPAEKTGIMKINIWVLRCQPLVRTPAHQRLAVWPCARFYVYQAKPFVAFGSVLSPYFLPCHCAALRFREKWKSWITKKRQKHQQAAASRFPVLDFS